MNTIEMKRAEFRQYLEASGIMDALSYALIKLYDETVKPENPVEFVRRNFKTNTNAAEPIEVIDDGNKSVGDSDALELVQKLQNELAKAKQEILSLRSMLQTMNQNVNGLDIAEVNRFNAFGNDPHYADSLIKKHLTTEMLEKTAKATPSIMDCIEQSQILRQNAVGIAAIDADCYTQLAVIFKPIIEDFHCVAADVRQPNCQWGDSNEFEAFNNDSVQQIRIACRRSVGKHPFVIGMNEDQLTEMLAVAQQAIQKVFTDEVDGVEGAFYKITDVNETEPIFDELKSSELGFGSMDAAEHRHWPVGRGLYVNGGRNLSILINENDHLRFVSSQKGGDFESVYRTLISAVKKLEPELEFVNHEKFGWLTMCPSNVGTALDCHVRMKLNKPTDYLNEIAKQFHLDIVDMNGEDCSDEECLIEIHNKRVFGLSEFDCIKTVYYGVKELIRRNAGDDPPADELLKKEECEEEVAAQPCDEQQAETSLTSVQSNGTYTKDPVDLENVDAPEPSNGENVENVESTAEANENEKPEEPQVDHVDDVADEKVEPKEVVELESNEAVPAADE